jgi:PHP family Zn ribbon phosphoesterase
MFYLKGCSKCHGDLTLENDAYGAFLKCLQCGKLTEVNVTGGRQSVLHGATFD